MYNNQNCSATISVTRVLDKVKKQFEREHAELELRGIPKNAVAPYVFVSARSVQFEAIVSGLSVSSMCEKECSHVKCNVTVPLAVTLTDANNVCFTCKSKITVGEEVNLHLPEPCSFPFEIVADAVCNCPWGVVIGDKVDCRACLTVYTKVVTKADMLIRGIYV